MKKYFPILIFIFFIFGCSASKIQLDNNHQFISSTGKEFSISLLKLDQMARKYVIEYWEIPSESVYEWNLREAEYNDYHGGFMLKYDQNRIAPIVGVLFDEHGSPMDIMYFK